MPDVNDLLGSDARRWRAAVASPPDLRAAVRIALDAGDVSRRRHRPVLVASIIAVVALIGVGTGVVVLTHSNNRRTTVPDGAPSAVTAHGRRLPYAGTVAWSGAVADTASPKELHIYADGDRVRGRRVCGLPHERVVVRETADAVTVRVAAYAPRIGDLPCAGVGHAPQRRLVRLQAPLGQRRLIDATTGRMQPVLDASTVPEITGASPCAANPLTWSPGPGLATRSYCLSRSNLPRVELTYRLDATNRPFPPPRENRQAVARIDGSHADVFVRPDGNHVDYTVQWLDDGHAIRLIVYPPAHGMYTRRQVLIIARSVR